MEPGLKGPSFVPSPEIPPRPSHPQGPPNPPKGEEPAQGKKDCREEPREVKTRASPSGQQSDQGQPKGNQPINPAAAKIAARSSRRRKGSSHRPGNDVEIWGNLPIHLRDIFRAEGQGDMPARYRDWIDSYYRRLNERGDH